MIMKQILNKDSKHELVKAFQLLDDEETVEIFYNILKCMAKKFGYELTHMMDEAASDE